MKTAKGRVSMAVAAAHLDLSPRAFGDLCEAGVIERETPNVGYVLDVVRVWQRQPCERARRACERTARDRRAAQCANA